MALRKLPVLCVLWCLSVSGGAAQPGSLFAVQSQAQPLFARATGEARVQSASLFGGRDSGLFAPVQRAPALGAVPRAYEGRVAQLRDLIAQAEAGPLGYDAVQYGARIKPGKPPTHMTLAEVFAWIKDTPGQPHAIGRYQFIPKTLAYLIEAEGVPLTARFSPALQDRLADRLLDQAGLQEFLAGDTGHVAFMNAIAKVWAGLPTSAGRSYYAGYAGNKASITWAHFKAEMVRIFPET